MCNPVINATQWYKKNVQPSDKNEIKKATQWESLIEMCKPVISKKNCASQWYNKIKCANKWLNKIKCATQWESKIKCATQWESKIKCASQYKTKWNVQPCDINKIKCASQWKRRNKICNRLRETN